MAAAAPVGPDRWRSPTPGWGCPPRRSTREGCASAFELASRLGYDGVEVMVWTDPLTREAGALRTLAELHGIPVLSVHAPTLLVTQRVWGTDPWVKVDRSVELAHELGADTVVLHPPFRWQREYARDFVDGVAVRENDTGMRLAVENMYPWRGPAVSGGRGVPAALGPRAAALRPRDARPVAHGDVRLGRDGDGGRARRPAHAPPPRRRGGVAARRAPRARARDAAVR